MIVFQISGEESNSFDFQILDIKEINIKSHNINPTSFVIKTIVGVYNPTNENMTFNHPDSCGFKTKIIYYEHRNWDNNFNSFCLPVITRQTFSPGTTNSSVKGWINFSDKTITKLPDGRYTVSMEFVETHPSGATKDLGFTILNGEITSKLINFTRWGTVEVTSQTTLPFTQIFSYLMLIIVFMRKIKKAA